MESNNWIELQQPVTIDILIAALEEARLKYGGDAKIEAIGCYQSIGKIESIGKWEPNKWYNDVLLVTDVCSG